MSKLSKQFEILVATLQKYDLYKDEDEVSHELALLRDVIDEVEKRIFLADKTAKRVYGTISTYTKEVDGGKPFIMGVTDHDVIHTGMIELETLMNLDDDQPSDENWENLFYVRFFKVTSDIDADINGGIFDVLHIRLNDEGQRIAELNAHDPKDYKKNLWVNLETDGICLTETQKKAEETKTKKADIEIAMLELFEKMGMNKPDNLDEIIDFVLEDVNETADPINWSNADVTIAFRRWIESKAY